MECELSDEVKMLKSTVEEFVRKEIVPAEQALAPEVREFPEEVLKNLQAKARSAGFWCFDAPAEYGGAGLSTTAFVAVTEAASKHKFCFPHPGGGVFGVSPPVVLYSGTQKQIEKFVLPAIEYGWRTFNAISEATGGSDPARAIKTTATRRGASYIINGTKLWTSHADKAKYGVVYARTSAQPGRKGISALIVERESPGISVRVIPVLRDHWTTEVVFNNVEVPMENLVGAEGEGFVLAQRWLARARLRYAAQAIGVSEEAIRMASEWARVRETFGAVLASRQSIQFAIADAAMRTRAARWLTFEAGLADERGEDAHVAAAIAKVYGTEAGFETVDAMMQILGGMGVSQEHPIEHWFRGLRVSRIVDGASEVLRFMIARDILGSSAFGRVS